MEFLRLLAGTVTLRPYVFIFFAIYLFIAVTSIGVRKTIVFTLLAYAVAFAGEYTSSHGNSGIPFGVYRYVAATTDRELWVAGVPFMDSMSFTFLSFISYRLAILLRSPLLVSNRDVRITPSSGIERSVWTAVLAGFLMMYLDLIIDPVALQGDRWFLGRIYYYPSGGPYFGVTLANFAGWFVVCFAIVAIFIAVDRLPEAKQAKQAAVSYPLKALAPAGLYFGILGFNLWITFRIGEVQMGLAGLFISLPLLMLVILHVRRAQPLPAEVPAD